MRWAAALGFVLLLVACAHDPRPGRDETIHVVRSGETLSSISRRYGASVEEIAERNELSDVHMIRAGQRLIVPAERTSRAPAHADHEAPIEIPEWVRDERGATLQAPVQDLAPAEAAGSADFIWPADGVVISNFGPLEGGQHDGIDIGAPDGSPVWATRAGVVLFAGEQSGFGKLVIVRHESDLISIYAHNQENLVSEGQRVEQGQVIARVGRTGGGQSPTLHFEMREGTKPVNPLTRLP